MLVFIQYLAVIGGYDHYRIPGQPQRIKFTEYLSYLDVGKGDLSIIATDKMVHVGSGDLDLLTPYLHYKLRAAVCGTAVSTRECLQVPGRWVVGSMGVEPVEPEKEPGIVPVSEPGSGRLRGRIQFHKPGQVPLFEGQFLVDFPIGVETLVETVVHVEGVTAYESPSRVTAVLQDFSQGPEGGIDRTLMADRFMGSRIHPREDRRMRWESLRGLTNYILKEDTSSCEVIDDRARALLISVTAEMIGPEGVYGYDEQIGPRSLPAARQGHQQADQQSGRASKESASHSLPRSVVVVSRLVQVP
jgi:hypothetical protein